MAEIGAQIELSEGDLVMTFNKTIDLMRQVWEMLVSVKPEHPLRTRLQQAESLLRRDIVEHSLALGFAPIELPEIARAELEAAKAAPPRSATTTSASGAGTTASTPDARGPKTGNGPKDQLADRPRHPMGMILQRKGTRRDGPDEAQPTRQNHRRDQGHHVPAGVGAQRRPSAAAARQRVPHRPRRGSG